MPVNSLVVFPELDINTGIDLSGFGLKVLQSLWMVSADPEISQSKSGDQSGDIIFGVLQKSKVKQFTCLVTGISQDDLREKLDNIEKHLNPTRGNLWFKFDMDSSSNIDVTRRRMVRGRRNSPIQVTYLGGMLRAKFQFSVLVNSGHENSIALTESLTNAISADPTVVVVPLVGGISNTRVFARIDIINNGSDIPDGTDITVANDGVDIDGDVVTSGVFTLTGGLQNGFTLRLDLERQKALHMHPATTSGIFVSRVNDTLNISQYPPFVGAVTQNITVTGVTDGNLSYQYLAEFL